MDVQAAVSAGSTAIGLLTGIFDKETLQNCSSPDDYVIILQNLEDVDQVLHLLLMT